MNNDELQTLETDAGFPLGSKWAISTPPTTQFIVHGVSIKNESEVLQNISDALLSSIKGQKIDLEETNWAVRAQCEQLPVPFMCCDDISNPNTLIFETILHPADPLGHHADIINILLHCFPELQGISDTGCNSWYSREDLKKELKKNLPPNPDFLFCIESIQEKNKNETNRIRTIGLERASRPEINIHEVPEAYTDEMASILAEIAALSLEVPISEPGKKYSLAENIFGLIEIDKNIKIDTSKHDQVHIKDIDGTSWPHSLLTAVQKKKSGVWRSKALSKRIQYAAQNSWNLLLRTAKNKNINILIAVPWTDDSEQKKTEHIWFEVKSVTENKLLASPMHTPAIASIPNENQFFQKSDISDWRITTPIGLLGPFDTDALNEFLLLSGIKPLS